MAISCCDIVAPIRLGDSVAVITLVAGEPDPVSGIVFTAEGCDCGYADIYCLTPNHRLLTSDLRWVPGGEIKVGDELLAFEEEPSPGNRNRRWQRALVTRSEPAMKQCVRVSLSNGDVIDCSADHPWLGMLRYADADFTQTRRWIAARDLGRRTGRLGQPPTVTRIFDVWDQADSFDAGWLSGVFDGEGTLVMHQIDGKNQARLSFSQKPGLVLDRALEIMDVLKFQTTISITPGVGVANVIVRGGVEEILRLLGTLRPVRLLSKFQQAPLEARAIRSSNYVSVLAVEDLGLREVQSIATSSGTYIAEGYLMHNSDIYCDVTEGGLYPHASITDTSYELISLPAEHSLVIDAVEREVRLIETDTGLQVGGIDSLEFSGIFEWIEAAKGGCVRVCIDPTNATLNADTTVAVQRYDREL